MKEIRLIHLKVLGGVFGSLFMILLGLLVYIWQDNKSDQKISTDAILDNLSELKSTVQEHDAEILEIKKHILTRDNVDIDEKLWKKAIDRIKGNTRGGDFLKKTSPSYEIVFVPENDPITTVRAK